MAKFNNDYLNRLLGVDQVNPSSGLTDPEVRKALEGYEKPNSTYREKFGDAGQGRAYTSTHKDAVVYRGNDYNYIDEKNKSQGTLAPTTLNPFSSESYYNWNMRLGVLGNLALSTGVKAFQGIGFVAGGLADLTESAGVGIYNAFSKEDMERQGNIFTRVADNGINQALDSLDPVVKDLFPVFKANNYEDKNFGQKALTSEFWSTDVVDGLAFAASAYLTGSAMTKGLQVGAKSAKLLGIGNRALRLAQAGSKTALPNVQRYIAATDFTTNVLANTAIESMFEAKDVRDAILSDPALAMKYSPEEIQQIAAEKARDVFGLNMLFVALSNLFELYSLTAKGLKGASRATRKADKLVGMNAMGEYSKINPLWYQKPTAQIGKAILGNAASEGLYEENIQYNIQNLSKLNAHRGPGSSFGEAVGNMFTGLGDLATDITKEQATSIGLGGLIGGGMQLSHFSPKVNKALGGDGGIIENYRNKLKQRDKLYESLTSTATSASGLDIFEREAPTNYTLTKEQDENGELVSYMQKEGGEKRKIAEFTWKALATNAGLDLEKGGTAKMALPLLEADGSPKVDLGKLESMYTKVKRREELNNVYEALSASPEKNKYSLDIVKSAMIADLAMAHFDAGLGQQLYQKLDSLLQANPESLELIGTSAISSPMELQKLKDYVTNLEELYNGLEVGIVNSVATPKQQQERKQVMFDRAARVLAIDNLTGELTKEIDSQIRQLQTTQPELMQTLSKEREALLTKLIGDESRYDLANVRDWELTESTKAADQAQSFMDTLSNSSVTKNDPAYLVVMNNLAKLVELSQSRSDLYEEWKNLSNLYKGEKYFLDNFDGISKKYDYITPTIDINNTTIKEYLNWERTQLPIVQLRSKLHANNSDYLNRMIKDLLAKGESLVHVVDWAIANEVALSKYHVDMILEELEEFQDSLIALKEEQDDIAKQIRDAELNDASDDVLDELDAKLADVKTQLNEARAALGSYFNMDPTELGKILTDLRKRNTFENFQIKDYIEELGKQHLGHVEATLAAFNNNDSFDDLASVESAIVTVQSLLNIFTKRKDAEAFTKFAGELQELLDELEKALEVVTDRHLNKFRKEYNRVNSLADGIVEVLADPDVKELLPNVGEVMSLLETDKLTRTENEQTKEERVRRPISFNLFAILTALNNNRDLAAFVQSKVNALVTEFLDTNKNYDFYKQNPKFRAFVDSFEEAIRVNPVRAIKGFLLEESSRGGTMGTYSYDKGPDSSLATYLAEGDVDAMIASLQGTEVRPQSSALSNAQLLEIAQMLKQLEVLELVKSVAQSEQSPAIFLNTFEKELKGHEAAFKADKSFTPAASIVQSLAIFQIYDALFKALGATATERFSNWTYFKGPGGAGKALPLTTRVYTKDGVRQIGDLKVGDFILGSQGETEVIGVYPQGKKKEVKITFSDGRTVVCCEDHLWSFTINGVRDYKLLTLPTKYIDPTKAKFFLPKPKAVDFNAKEFFIPPYVLGILLGDGSLNHGTVAFTNIDLDIIDRVRNIVAKDGIRLTNNDITYRLITDRGKPNPYLDEIRRLGIDKKSIYKFIPQEYLYGSKEQRLELLRGLLDTDGTIGTQHKGVSFSSSSKRLIEDVKILAESLGLYAGNVRAKKTTHELHYRITIERGEDILFHASRKANRYSVNQNPTYSYVQSVEYLDTESEMVCIKVDAEDELFLVEDYVLTHNTNVVVRYAVKALGISPKQIVTAGHNKHSAEGIQSSIGNEKTFAKEDLITQLSNKTLLEGTKLLIIDEIGGFSQQEIEDIASLVQANYPTVPLIVMGDPNQVTASLRESVAVEKGFTSTKDSILQGIYNIVDVTPLFTRFRSDNPAIVNLQDSFLKRKEEFTGGVGVANVDASQITSTDTPIIGTYIDSTTGNLLPILFNSYSKNPNRTRAVIVATPEQQISYKAQIEKSFPNSTIEVLTYIESQGRTIDEVYVHIPFDKGVFPSIIEHSQAMYTATSRGKQFVYLSGVKGASNKVDIQLAEKANSIKKQKDDNFTSILEYISSAQTILKGLNISIVDATSETKKEEEREFEEDTTVAKDKTLEEILEQELTDEEKQEIRDDRGEDNTPESLRDEESDAAKVNAQRYDEVEEIDEDVPETDQLLNSHTEKTIKDEVEETTPITPENTSSESISLLEPSSDVFNPITINYKGQIRTVFQGLNALIKGNTPTDVHLMRTTTVDGVDQVVMAVRPDANENIFVTIAVLSKEELGSYDTSSLPLVVRTGLEHNVFEVNKLPANFSSLYKLDLANTKPLKYRYERIRSKFDALEVFRKWVKSFFWDAAKLGNEGELERNLRVVVPTSPELESGGKYASLGASQLVQAGKPFLLLRGGVIKRTTASGSTISRQMKDQAIMLTPRFLNVKNKVHFSRYIEPIQNYIKHVRELETIIAKHLIDPSLAATYKLGSHEFAMLVAHLSNIEAMLTLPDYSLGKETTLSESDQNYGYLFKLFKLSSFTSPNSPLLAAALAVDQDIHGKWEDRIKMKLKASDKSKDKQKVASYERNNIGPAQQAFDKIARANLWMNVGSKAIVLRDSRPATFVDAKGKLDKKDVVGGRTLLGWVSSDPTKVKTNYTGVIQGYLRQASERSKAKGFDIDFNVNRNLDNITGRKVMNIEELEAIFGDAAFNEKGEHSGKKGSGLRIPISRRLFQKKTVAELEKDGVFLSDYFDDTFVRVEPNRVSVFPAQGSSTATVPDAPVVQPVVPERKYEDQTFDDLVGFSEVPSFPQLPQRYAQFLGQNQQVDFVLQNHLASPVDIVAKLKTFKSKRELDDYFANGTDTIKVDYRELGNILFYLNKLRANADTIATFSELTKYSAATAKLRRDSNIYFALPNAAPIYEGRPNVNAVFVNGPDVAVVKWRATNMKEVLYTARHELIHSVIYDIMRYDRKKFLSLANQIRNSKEFNAPIARHGGRSIRQILETGQYKNKSAENKDNEALTIFFTEIAAGNLKLAAATENKVVKWLRSLLSSVGLEWLLFNPSADIYTLAEGIAVAFAQGTPLRSLGIKPTEHLDFAEAPIEPVDMTQLAQLYRQLNPMTMKQVFKAWLSGKSARNAAEADMFTVVNGAHLEHVYGKKAFGLFKAGSIAIEQGLNEVKAKEVLQHEIFHKIFHRFLNQEERAVLIADAKAKYTYLQGATDLEIEHFLIEVFNSYVYKPTDLFDRLALFFDKLLFRIGLFNRSANTIDTFFKRLYSRYYAGDGKYESQATIAADKLEKYFAGSLKLYENAKALTLGFIRRKYSYEAIESKLSGDQLYTNPPLTFDEAVASLEAEYKFQMKAWLHQNPNTPLDERVVVFDLLANNKAARDEIIRSLFPDIKITRDNKKKGTGGTPDELLELEDEEAEIEDNKIDFGKNQEEIDQQRNVIRNVKQVLSTLQYRDKNDKLQYVPFPTAYAILIKLLNGLSTEGTIEDQVKFVSRRLTDIGRTPESLAVLAFVTDVINGLYIEDAGKANFIQFNGDDKVTIDTANRTYSGTKARDEDQQTFLTRVYEETKDLGFTQKEIYEGYKLYRYRNMYALLGSSIRSLRKQVNFYGVREKIKGNYIYKYFAGRESGSQASLIAIIQGQILAKYKKDANVFTASQWKMFTTERIRTRTEAEDKRVKQVISQYLTTLGYNPRIRLQELIENNTIVQEDLNTLYDAIVYFNKRLQAAIDPKSNTDVEEFVLTEEATFFRTIQEALQFSDPDFQSSSSIRGDGKRIYPYVNGSYGLDVLNYFVKLGKHVGAHWTPKFMRTNFYQNNLFVNGFLTMKSVVDHDSIKYKGLDNTAKLFNKETALDWFARNFLYGFVGALEVGSEGSLSYFQFLDTPSNKPKTQAVDVEIINMNKANAALDLMRYQETTRDKHAVQQYSPDQSYVATGEEMQKGVDTFLQQLINNNVLSLMNLDTIYKKLNKVVQRPDVKVETRAKEILEKLKEKSQRLESFLSSTQATEELSEEEVKVIQEVTDKIQEEALELLEMSDIETLLAYYRPISELYYYNYYVNSHQLRQLVIGDPAFYKNGSEAYDIIKRMSIALAPGKVGVVNERLGFMKSKIRVGVSKDAEKFINNPEIQGLLDKYDATDAQGFVTPDFARRVKRSYGFEEALDVTMKPVHFEIDENGIPRALKFSTIELTDELVGKFPALKVLRDAMEASNIDIATFKSAVKVGVPAKLAENNHPEYEVTSAYEEDNIFELRAENFRIQLNPAHDAIAFTANPSQLSYQGIINEGNLSQLMRINELNAKIIAIGSKQLGKIFQLRGNTPTSKTRDVTRGLAMSSWFDMPGFEGLWRLVNNKNIDLNMPILQKSIERLIASKWSRGSVGFKFLGSKLVLQADYGVSHIIDKDGKTVKASPLVWKDDQSYHQY